ncbi:hypothetical protein ACFYZT_05675 [Streptomyces sp. NPDC001591]|uniref:hypothetical protein n=1 Tax=Streptomyces sp. NPDC001591 TaxID=3364589 RepID=UPI0036CFC858
MTGANAADGAGRPEERPSPPSRSPGEAGDSEARERADEAVTGQAGDEGDDTAVPATPPPTEAPD